MNGKESHMKNSRLTKILALLLCLVLVIGAVVAIVVLADEDQSGAIKTTDKVGIAAVNLDFGEKHQMVYAVRADEEYLAETDGMLCLLFWDHDPEADGEKSAWDLYKSAQDRKFTETKMEVNGEECYVFTSSGVAVSDLGAPIYVLPVVRHVSMSETDDGEYNYSFTYTKGYSRAVVGEDTVSYEYGARETGVVAYAVQQILSANVPADASAEDAAKVNNKLALYTNLINLAGTASAEKMSYQIFGIANAEYGQTVAGALFKAYSAISNNPFNYMDATAIEGAITYDLRAYANTADGAFIGWANENGEILSTSRFITLSVSALGYAINGTPYQFESAAAVVAPMYGDANASPYITYQNGTGTSLAAAGSCTQSFKNEDGNSYLNIKKYQANEQIGETKLAIAANIADTLEVGKTYVAEFDIRFNDFVNAIYTVDENGKYTVTNMGSSWWSYIGFIDDIHNASGGLDFADKHGITINGNTNKQSVTLADGTKKDIYDAANSTFLGKKFNLDDYSDWVTIRAELDILEITGDDVTKIQMRFYANDTLMYTKNDGTYSTSNNVKTFKLQASEGLEAFYIKFKSMNKNAGTQYISGYDFDIDNITSYVIDTPAS